jgi:hypothetical protein
VRTARAALALLLALAVPVRADSSTDPLWTLLSTYVLQPDPNAPGAEEGDAKGLAGLQADLLLLSDGFEAFRDEAQVKASLERLEPRISPELRPFFKDRASSLDAVYRTLAVTDYTWAGRLPDPPCGPGERRAALLGSGDRLFADEKGGSSLWLVALLGPRAQGKQASAALDQASAAARLTPAEYERLRAKARRITLALQSPSAEGFARAKLYCGRADVYEKLAAHHRAKAGGLIEAGQARGSAALPSVLAVAGEGRRVAATVLAGKGGARYVVTDAAGVLKTDAPRVLAHSAEGAPVELKAAVLRRHPTLSLALLSVEGGDARPALRLAEQGPETGALVEAVGHSEVSGLWTRSSGLVTRTDSISFQTDAVVSAEFSGGPVFDESGAVAGILITHPAHNEEGHWPVAVPAPLLARWLEGEDAAVPAPEPVSIEDSGTAAILSHAAPAPIEAGLGAWNIPPMGPPPPTVRGVCVSNCGGGYSRSYSSGSSSYSSGSGGEELGRALGQALAPLVEALIFRGIPALFRGIASLFKRKPGTSHPTMSSPSVAAPKPRPADPPKKPTPPPPPPKPECRLNKVAAPSTAGIDPFEVAVAVSCTGDKARLSGHTVTFTFEWDGKRASQTLVVTTDGTGNALASIQVVNEETKRGMVQRRSDEHADELESYAAKVAEEEGSVEGPAHADGLVTASETVALAKGAAVVSPAVAAPAAIHLAGRGAVLRVTATLTLGPAAGAAVVLLMAKQTFDIGWHVGSAIEKHVSDVQRGLKQDEKEDCEFARRFHLRSCVPPIEHEHQFKEDHGAIPNRLFDICACRDGSIIIKAHGMCGKPGPSIPTDRRWK